MLTKIWISTFCLLVFTISRGQNEWKSTYNQSLDIQPSFALNNDFNTDDWYTGVSGGIEDKGYQWGVRLGFEFRPFRKKIQIAESNNYVKQYLERKYFIHLDLDKRFGHFGIGKAHLQFYAGVRSGFLMGNYSGTRNDAENHWVASPFAGVCLNSNDAIYLKLGYQYFNDHLLNVDDGRVNIMVVFMINQ